MGEREIISRVILPCMTCYDFRYVLGTLMGLYAVKLLLPAAVGLINGLVSGFNNMKHLLPHSSMLGSMSVVCAAVVLPIFAGFLGAVLQVVGDEYFLSPGMLALCAAVAMPVAFAGGLMDHRATDSSITTTLTQLFYMQYIAYTVGAMFIFGYMYNDSYLRQFLTLDYVRSPEGRASVAYLLARLLASCTLSKIMTIDSIVNLSVKEYMDLKMMAPQMKSAYVAKLQSMRNGQTKTKTQTQNGENDRNGQLSLSSLSAKHAASANVDAKCSPGPAKMQMQSVADDLPSLIDQNAARAAAANGPPIALDELSGVIATSASTTSASVSVSPSAEKSGRHRQEKSVATTAAVAAAGGVAV